MEYSRQGYYRRRDGGLDRGAQLCLLRFASCSPSFTQILMESSMPEVANTGNHGCGCKQLTTRESFQPKTNCSQAQHSTVQHSAAA